ncbi:MAG: hypothetical protein HQM02_07240, partial [Magnetococcales bacterium]|nr:hypothetical protein [Magnetococcales bacterium]
MRAFLQALSLLLVTGRGLQAAPSLLVQVPPLPTVPVVDGVLEEWGREGWVEIPLRPARENDPDNVTGSLNVQLKAGTAGGRIFVAARWPDQEADVSYRPWKWTGTQYKRGKQRDDMFIVRFDMGGDYAACMLSKTDYRVDLWQWSAGRSDQAGVAEDFIHVISTASQENAAEYEHPEGGTVYIRKIRDAGNPVYDNQEAGKENRGESLPGIRMLDGGSGSLIDVQARGVWKDGFWHLELARKLDTGHDDDVKLQGIKTIRGAIAVFNKSYAEHKSVSET